MVHFLFSRDNLIPCRLTMRTTQHRDVEMLVRNINKQIRSSLLEFSINVSLNSLNSVTKNICHYSKRTRTCHLLCKRPGCYHSASKTHMRGSLNWAQFMLQWFIRFLAFAESTDSSTPFRKNSIGHLTIIKIQNISLNLLQPFFQRISWL